MAAPGGLRLDGIDSPRDVRPPSHAGRWYPQDPQELSTQLEGWLNNVQRVGSARAIIAPHSQYEYCGATAAHAFKQIVPDNIRRIFILGPPSVDKRLYDCALSTRMKYRTPFGYMNVDREATEFLFQSQQFKWVSHDIEDREHSIEMMLPFLAKVMESRPADSYTIVPVFVGYVNGILSWGAGHDCDDLQGVFRDLFAPYFKDPSNLFVISSDFCHWGKGGFMPSKTYATANIFQPTNKELDKEAMEAISSLDPAVFNAYLDSTRNNICGRNAICVLMQAISHRMETDKDHTYEWQFLDYSQSKEVLTVKDRSVAFAAGALFITPK